LIFAGAVEFPVGVNEELRMQRELKS